MLTTDYERQYALGRVLGDAESQPALHDIQMKCARSMPSSSRIATASATQIVPERVSC